MTLNNIPDKDLINELSVRIERIRKENNAQESLMAELRKVNERLIHSEKIKTNFLSNIRNEINNPVTSILGLSQAIINSEHDQELTKRLSGLLHNDVFNLDMQLRNIFLSADIEAGNFLITPSRVNVVELIENHIQSFSHIIKKKKLRLNSGSNLKADFITDTEYFSHIVSNLLSNAVNFCNEGGEISVQIILTNRRLELTVTNTGGNIDESKIPVMFDRFRQLEEGLTKPHYGHGLGLSIVKALLENLNGNVSVANDQNGIVKFTVVMNEFDSDEDINSVSADGNDFLFIEENSTVL